MATMQGKPLVTVRPGPVLHVWRDGAEVAAVPLDHFAALTLAADLLHAVTQAGGMSNSDALDAGTGRPRQIPMRTKPREILP